MKQTIFFYCAALLMLPVLGGCNGSGGNGYNGGGAGYTGGPTLLTLTIAPANPTLAFGTSQQITASGYYSDGSTQDLTSVATWQSSAPDIATVTAGLVTSAAVGQTTITATSASISGSVTVSVGGVIRLPQTGQVTSYAPGDDGAIQAGSAWPSPRFAVNDCGTPADITDDVVVDQHTGLMWVRYSSDSTTPTRAWQESVNDVNGLSRCGFSDWRLANVNELESLVNAGENTYLWLGTQGFNMWGAAFWSSTSHAPFNDRAWNVDVYGEVKEYPKSSTGYAWAVRAGATAAGGTNLPKTGQTACYDAAGAALPSCAGSGQDGELLAGVVWPSPRFSLNECATPADPSDDMITDNLTGLMWPRQADLFGLRTWAQALPDANDLSLCGYTDWRLPNNKELHSLAHYGQMNVGDWLEAQGFQNVQSANALVCYWTSTSYPLDTANRSFCVYLRDGRLSPETKTNTRYVWPVRGGL